MRLIVKSFLAHRKRSHGPVQERILNTVIRAFHYPQLINLFEEIFIWNVYSFSSKVKAPVIVDCGSNIGMSVLYFKTQYPESKILAFEPDLTTFQFLKDNVGDNKLSHVEMHQSALSNIESQSVFYSKPGNSGRLTMSLIKSEGKTDESKVAVKKLSTYIDRDVDLLKIDVEGAELLIVQDLIDSKKINQVRQMIVEYHPLVTQQPVESFVSLLEVHNFSCTAEKDTIHPGATEIIVRAVREN